MSSYVVKRDVLAAEAVALYKQLVLNAGFVIIDHAGSSYVYSEYALNNTIQYYATKKTKKFHLTGITPVKSSLVMYASGVNLGTKRKANQITYADRTGAFQLEFSDGSIFILFKYWSGAGSALQISYLLVGEESTFRNYLKFCRDYGKVTSKPRNGIFTIKTDGAGNVIYDKLKKIQHTPVVHPSVEEVTTDLDNYFDNVSEFTKYGMSGVRKVLLVGPPGTGKSSYAYQIAARHKTTKSVVFADGVNSVAKHLAKCGKANTPTIIIWEDAESTGLSRAGSDILNFLDGIDQPPTKQGAYIMMTTNFPEMIDARIKKRPGRVDRIFEFGNLRAEYALKCAQIYFYGLFPYKFTDESQEAKEYFEKLVTIVDGMSGASIKGLAYSSRLYAAGAKLTITLDLVAKVKEDLAEDLSKVDKYADPKDKPSVGFQAVTKERLEKLDWNKLLKD